MAPPSCPNRVRQIDEGTYGMRMFFGIIIGCALTIGGAYVADSITGSTPPARPMVNWDVVGQHVETLTTFARDSWKKIMP
jgi:hypothetical protein